MRENEYTESDLKEFRDFAKQSATSTENNFERIVEKNIDESREYLKKYFGLTELGMRDERMLKQVVNEITTKKMNEDKMVGDGKLSAVEFFSSLGNICTEASVLFINRRFGLSPNEWPNEQFERLNFFSKLQDKESGA